MTTKVTWLRPYTWHLVSWFIYPAPLVAAHQCCMRWFSHMFRERSQFLCFDLTQPVFTVKSCWFGGFIRTGFRAKGLRSTDLNTFSNLRPIWRCDCSDAAAGALRPLTPWWRIDFIQMGMDEAARRVAAARPHRHLFSLRSQNNLTGWKDGGRAQYGFCRASLFTSAAKDEKKQQQHEAALLF